MTNNSNNNNIKSLLDLDPTLDTCGCCEDSALTQPSDNRPGLSAIRYRLGTYDTFMRQLIEQLARPALPGYPTLAALKTRRLDDGAIALLDAWAMVADVLTFYQERIANENYLLTATERRSVLALARTLGYELNPGVAASTYLAFTVEAATDPHQTAKVPAGTQIQSLPEQDQLPQTFETSTEITARAAWNNLRSPQTRAHVPTGGDRTLYLRGLNTRLAPGDWLLFVGEERLADAESDRWEVRRLLTVETDAKANHTRVTWDLPIASDALPEKPSVYTFRTRANIYGHNAQSWRSYPDTAKATYLGLGSPDQLTDSHREEWPAYNIFSTQGPVPSGNFTGSTRQTVYPTPPIDLDAIYKKITPGSWVMLSYANSRALYQVNSLTEAARSDFGLTGKTTRLTLLGQGLADSVFEKAVRGTLVYAESEALEVADLPLTEPIAGQEVDIQGLVEHLLPGVPLAVSGKVVWAKVDGFEGGLVLRSLDQTQTKPIPAGALLWVEALPISLSHQKHRWTLRDLTGFVGTVDATTEQITYAPALESDETVSEIAFLKQLPTFNPVTHLQLKAPLTFIYDRATFSINANVVPATHGETVSTVLGSGDGAQPHQTFTLKKPPLTYLSSSSASGRETTLSVRVNNMLWSEADSFFGRDPSAENYIVRLEDDGTTNITFGDSHQGARLPTGTENITTTYRSGIGLVGEVASGSLTLLKQRPLGIRAVTNPVAATGAENAENLSSARTNAPLTVLTLDRLVSRQDYEDFARAFAGIGKAQAVEIWDGFVTRLHITLAAANGDPIVETSPLQQNLNRAMETLRDPGPPFILDSFRLCRFDVAGKLLIDERYDPEIVKSQTTNRLLAAFEFSRRQFGQGVSAAEVIALMQSVPGVIAVDLDALHRSEQGSQLETYLDAAIAQWDAAKTPPQVTQVELLLINPAGIELEVNKR